MLRHLKNVRFSGLQTAFLLTFVIGSISAIGQALTLPNTFVAGDTARASEVNENFVAIQQAVDEMQADLVASELARMDLESRLLALETKTALMSVSNDAINGLAGPHVIFEGANVHVRSGSGATNDTTTGLGNLIVGYNEAPAAAVAGRAGAHNIVLGPRNEFSSFGGMVGGADNKITAEQASIVTGKFGTASGLFSAILGGGGDTENLFNNVTGEFATISGGFRHNATGAQSAISGGSNHQATGFLSWVGGGTSNIASGAGAGVSGGAGNDAQSSNASISGGQGGVANGVSASIYGGINQTTTNNFEFAP